MEEKRKTPGYNHRLAIRFTTDKNGRPLAHYWSPRAQRWFRISMHEARMAIGADMADRLP